MKYNQFDLVEFFEKEPDWLVDKDAGIYLYSIEKDGFRLYLETDTYTDEIMLSIAYDNKTVFEGQYKNIVQIEKSDNETILIYLNANHRIVLNKRNQLGIIIES